MSYLKTKLKNAPIRIKSEWRKRSRVVMRKIKIVSRKLFGMPKTAHAYTIAILCVKRSAYVALAVNNINSCHFINPNHKFVMYLDNVCKKEWDKESRRLDYPNQTKVEVMFGDTTDPWQYCKIEMIIDCAHKNRASIDADELWHGDITLDPNKITFLAISAVFKDKPDESAMVSNIFRKPEWLSLLHTTTGFLYIPPRFMNADIERDLREYSRKIFTNSLSFIPSEDLRNGVKRISEELAVSLVMHSRYPKELITTLKIKDSPKNTEFLQPLYYGCGNQIFE